MLDKIRCQCTCDEHKTFKMKEIMNKKKRIVLLEMGRQVGCGALFFRNTELEVIMRI